MAKCRRPLQQKLRAVSCFFLHAYTRMYIFVCQVRACVALMALNDESGLLDALGWLEADEKERGKVDKAEFVQIRMKVCAS